MPILGIMASSMQPALNAGSFESIATTTGVGGIAELTFSSIPNTYAHLQLRIMMQMQNANWIRINFNGDSTASNYAYHEIRGSGTSANAYSATSNNFTILQNADAVSSCYAVAIVDILDYANTNKNKTVRTLCGYDTNGSGQNINFNSNLWMNTSAISSIRLFQNNLQGNFAGYSHFALYGIKSS